MTRAWRRIAAVTGAALLFACAGAHAQQPAPAKPFVLGLPGIPPVFLAVQLYTAQEAGFFRKYGVDVQLRPFDTGVAAARAAAAGEIDLTDSPTPVIINLVSNGNVPLVAVYGMENPDWLIGSTDPAVKTCKDLPGHPIGVDTPGGARSVALRQMTAGCGYAFDTLQQVALGSNTAAAMIAGQISVGVLHLDDVAVIGEKSSRQLSTVITMKQAKPVSHYNLIAARADKIAAGRDRYVRVVAALVAAADYMRDPNNADRVAQIGSVTGHSPREVKAALKQYMAIEFWPNGTDGLDPKKVQAEIDTQAKVGGIQPGKTPVAYDKLVDRSIWKDAMALVRQGR